MLKDTPILLGLTGGIAIYKSAELTRLLRREGAEVYCVMTRNSRRFVQPLLFEALSQNRVALDEGEVAHPFDHIRLSEKARVFVVAPATANLLGKLASGVADNLLTTMLTYALGRRAPILLAPAMNANMYKSPAVQENLRRLKKWGIHLVGPASGELACGDEGPGRMSEPEEILDRIKGLVHGLDLAGRKILVTAGPTREPLDPIRVLSNRSSGKMGYELARVAARRGARVTLVSGPTQLAAPPGINLVRIETAEELKKKTEELYPQTNVLIMAAAVADFRPRRFHSQKQKKTEMKSADNLLELSSTPDILKEISKYPRRGRVLIGFAAESENTIPNAKAKLQAKNLDLIVANDVSRPESGFEVSTNQVCLISADEKIEELPLLPKEEVAEKILDRVVKILETRRRPKP
ncbi:MAG: bifunctional phosphopantothenoylcysteine decarboxylase/phosphopantothenate--cysteine ligase CoaBC [Proteobacteria bacterium]|nr:bifunctional phosphopantothenoylcysteine decarboxylase/phosphopantothenate--cysteine ligase CoaBC [Pseudomonadota bacterium]